MGEMKDKDSGLSPSTRFGGRKGDVLYVAVLYRQELSESNAYRTLLHDRAHVYIHDNSPEAVSPAHLPEGWVYVSDPSNPGLSAAYNAAARYGVEHGFKWLMITDQDTTYAEGAGDRYEAFPDRYPEERIFIPRVTIPDGRYISPVRKRWYFAHPEKEPLTGRIRLAHSAVINSGLLIDLDAFQRCGGYSEKVFLDFSDFQFIDKFSQKYPYGKVIDEVLHQCFSALTDSRATMLKRYGTFCRSLKGYEANKLSARMGIHLAVVKRGVMLCVRSKAMEPLRILKENYLK